MSPETQGARGREDGHVQVSGSSRDFPGLAAGTRHATPSSWSRDRNEALIYCLLYCNSAYCNISITYAPMYLVSLGGTISFGRTLLKNKSFGGLQVGPPH